jgi:hypothetical protein
MNTGDLWRSERETSKPPAIGPEALRELEAELSRLPFRGMPLGAALNDTCVVTFLNGQGNWGLRARWKNRAQRVRYFLRRAGRGRSRAPIPRGRILLTWMQPNFRVSDLVLPVLGELGPDRSLVLCGKADVLPRVPHGTAALLWHSAVHFDRAAWRADYRKRRRAWQTCLAHWCRKYRAPRGAYDLLALDVMVASQHAAGCLEFLRRAQPSAILTDFDRNSLWSCLVPAARTLGIPTFTLVHGVLDEGAVGYLPVLADRVLCWGEIQRRQFIAAGEPPEKVIVAGCPRLTRELGVTAAEGRARLGLPADGSVVMLGTAPVCRRDCLAMAELFCEGLARLEGVSAIVRLHPSERLETYEPVMQRYPRVRFCTNSDATLDEALAAAEIVVVSSSGLGADALLKGRMTVVLDLPPLALGFGAELIEHAGCRRATTAEGLASAIRDLLTNPSERRRHLAVAERYVGEFCAFFGKESARRIVAIVSTVVPAAGAAGNGEDAARE